MEVISLTENDYAKWNKFCLESDDAWLYHTTKWLKYFINFNPELKSESKSFYIKENNKIIAICPLILEKNGRINQFSFAGGFGQLPALANNLSGKGKVKVLKFVFNEINRLAEDNQVSVVKIRYSVLCPAFIEKNLQRYNVLMQFGFLDTSLNTRIIDIRKSIEDLRKDIRHGHDSAINQAAKILEAEIFTSENITKKIFDQYVEMHVGSIKSRMNRPKITFDLMFEMIKEGDAFLIGARKGNLYVGYSYFNSFKGNVNYTSACHISKYDNLAIGHFIQWEAIKYMKNIGIKYYEIGWQFFANTLSNFPTEKELNISKFKRGFGGYTVPQFMGEKYFDKNIFIKEYKKRTSFFADRMGSV